MRRASAKRKLQNVDAVTDRRGHIDVGAGERAVVQRQLRAIATFGAIDGAAVQGEAWKIGADQRHGVGDEEQPAFAALGAKRDAQGTRIDMVAIGDDAAPGRGMVDRSTHEARRAMAHLAHGVEEMGDTAGAGVEAGISSFRCAVAVAEADDDAAFVQRLYLAFGYLLRRHGDQQSTDCLAGTDEGLDVAVFDRAHQLGQMRALAGRRQMRAFEMQTRDATVGLDRLGRRFDCSRRCRGDIGDQRRQQRRGAIGAMPSAIMYMDSGEGPSFSMRPPPPFTCASTKPGDSTPP